MKKERNWIIIDVQTKKALYGVNQKTLRFSTEDVALEVAEQLFDTHTRYLIMNIHDLGIQHVTTNL